jgi:adenylate kinase
MILFIGVAGAGKSVQGRHLSELLGCPWISTGELLRMHIGGEKRLRMLRGELLTDKELYDVIYPVLIDPTINSQVILDGFPRTEPQAMWLYDFSVKNNKPISYIVHIIADEEIVFSRFA